MNRCEVSAYGTEVSWKLALIRAILTVEIVAHFVSQQISFQNKTTRIEAPTTHLVDTNSVLSIQVVPI